MRAGERRDKADTWESMPCHGMVVTIKKIFFQDQGYRSYRKTSGKIKFH